MHTSDKHDRKIPHQIQTSVTSFGVPLILSCYTQEACGTKVSFLIFIEADNRQNLKLNRRVTFSKNAIILQQKLSIVKSLFITSNGIVIL